MGIPSQFTTLIMGAPVPNMATTTPLTNGDNAGVATGVASGTVMGPSRHMRGSFTTLVGACRWRGSPRCRCRTARTWVGARIVPSQVRVLVLAP